MGIISEEISKFYDLLCESKQPNLISLKHQYADFAVWQNEKNQLNKWENQLAYWKKIRRCTLFIRATNRLPKTKDSNLSRWHLRLTTK